jgi:predicted Rossmann-fold nucleotide-binding protein
MLFPGKAIQEGEVKNSKGECIVRNTNKPGEIEIIHKGLVVSICGGASLGSNNSVYDDVSKFTKYIIGKGGVVVNGGENYGSMISAAETEPDMVLGIACAHHKVIPYGPKAIVHNFFTRKMMIVSVPNVVVYEGGTGTLDEMIGAIGFIKSSQRQGLIPPEVYLSQFWESVYNAVVDNGVLPDSIKEHIHIFDGIEELKKMI